MGWYCPLDYMFDTPGIDQMQKWKIFGLKCAWAFTDSTWKQRLNERFKGKNSSCKFSDFLVFAWFGLCSLTVKIAALSTTKWVHISYIIFKKWWIIHQNDLFDKWHYKIEEKRVRLTWPLPFKDKKSAYFQLPALTLCLYLMVESLKDGGGFVCFVFLVFVFRHLWIWLPDMRDLCCDCYLLRKFRPLKLHLSFYLSWIQLYFCSFWFKAELQVDLRSTSSTFRCQY